MQAGANRTAAIIGASPRPASRSGRRDQPVPTLQHLLHVGDPAFAVDGAGRITAWNPAARRLFGFSRDARGQSCREVLECRDRRGTAICPQNCPLLQATRTGRLPPAATLPLRHRSGRTIEVMVSIIVVATAAGSEALITARPSPAWVVHASETVPGPARRGSLPTVNGRTDMAIDLAQVLDRLLLVTEGDAAELFLTTPAGSELVLTAHRGRAPRAFRQITRFERGQGFPGLVAQTGEALLTLDLAHDERYLRAEVKRQGFRSYLCVPIFGVSGLLGTLHIATRSSADGIALQRPFLEEVARELATALELRRLRAADVVSHQPLDPTADASTNLRHAVESSLRTLIGVAGADGGSLLLVDPRSHLLETAGTCDLSPEVHHILARPRGPEMCPAIDERRTVLPADRLRAECACCRALARHLPATVCLPLEVGGRTLGAVLLACRQREALPAQRLSFVHAALDRTALVIHNAQVALRQEHGERARAAQQSPIAGRAGDEGHVGSATAAAATPFLDLRCLGPFAMFRDGRPVPPEQFARRRSLTLLKILLTRYGKPVHREELVELLWPDANPHAARVPLNVVVHYLRRGLEPDVPADRPSSFICTSGDYYSFSVETPHRLDSQQFLELVRRAGRCEHSGRQVEAVEAYESAIALYRGDFLEDELYSDWCAVDREYLRESFLTVLRRTARLHTSRGDVDAAVACYRRALLVDATLEDVHRALMETLSQSGRRDEALRQYRECRAVLERELGISPMPETEMLRKHILASS